MLDYCSCGTMLTEETILLDDLEEEIKCIVCYKRLCKECAINIVSDYVCKSCDDEGAW